MSNYGNTTSGISSNSCSSNGILWSFIARNEIILAESGFNPYGGIVSKTAQELMLRPLTPGYEYHRATWKHTQQQQQQQQQQSNTIDSTMKRSIKESVFETFRQSSSGSGQPQIRGMKFHVFDPLDCNDMDYNHMITSNTKTTEDDYSNFRVWIFGVVFDQNMITSNEIQQFIDKIVELTILFRDSDEWKNCPDVLGLQNDIAPMLHQQMIMWVPKDPRVAKLEAQLEMSKQIMERNIELILDRGEQLQSLHEDATRLQELSLQFKKRTRDLKRYQLWQNAKYGIILGSAVTIGVGAAVAVPLLIL